MLVGMDGSRYRPVLLPWSSGFKPVSLASPVAVLTVAIAIDMCIISVACLAMPVAVAVLVTTNAVVAVTVAIVQHSCVSSALQKKNLLLVRISTIDARINPIRSLITVIISIDGPAIAATTATAAGPVLLKATVRVTAVVKPVDAGMVTVAAVATGAVIVAIMGMVAGRVVKGTVVLQVQIGPMFVFCSKRRHKHCLCVALNSKVRW